jgi:glutathionyl-hydroquinone reductase
MTDLVTILTTGKNTWQEVAKLINTDEWSKIFIITNEFGYNTFNKKENMEFIVINPDNDLNTISKKIYDSLKNKVYGLDVALNMISGTGKEHMALLSSLLKLGLGIRLVSFDNEIVEL